jgi:hypothetical protein
MGSFLVHQGAIVQCQHAGQAQPVSPYPRVKVGGQTIVTQTTPYTIAACSLSGSGSPPCATAQWVQGATRVRAGGQPVILDNSKAVCTPTGTGLQVLVTQKRVSGQ